MKRTCKRCGQEKDLSQFFKNPGCKDGHLHQCKECRKVYIQEYQKRPEFKDMQASRQLKHSYGITLADKKRMMIDQNNKCIVCLREFKNTTDACLDHNHKTGQNRKLLCNNCNHAVGEIHENFDTALRLAKYVLECGEGI